jgi:hypothetical protein
MQSCLNRDVSSNICQPFKLEIMRASKVMGHCWTSARFGSLQLMRDGLHMHAIDYA